MPTPDPAATVILVRDVHDGLEVLMVERNGRGFFGDMVVFPGGKVDMCDVRDGSSVEDESSHRNAAIRELAEETGILLTPDGAVPCSGHKGEMFYRWLKTHEVVGTPETLVLVSRWVTPEYAPRRFDTRFYLGRCRDDVEVRIDTDELVGYRWVQPASALESHQKGEIAMMLPTVAHLRWLQRRHSVDDAFGSARGADGRTLVKPKRVEDGSILPIVMPAEVA